MNDQKAIPERWQRLYDQPSTSPAFRQILEELGRAEATIVDLVAAAWNALMEEETKESIAELYLDALTENAKLKAELNAAIADRDRWERNSAAENKRAGDLEIKLRQVDAERDRARKAEGLINADHDAEIRRKARKEAAEVFENGIYEVWGSRPAAQAIKKAEG